MTAILALLCMYNGMCICTVMELILVKPGKLTLIVLEFLAIHCKFL